MLRKKIEDLLAENPKISIFELMKELEADKFSILESHPHSRRYDVAKLHDLFETLRSWEKVFLLVITESFVLEIKDKFPKGFLAHGFLNFHDESSSIGGHLTIDNIKHIFVTKDTMFGKDSFSIKFLDGSKKEIFSIYVPRDNTKNRIKEALDSFNEIFDSLGE